MIACFDVHYDDTGAAAAALVFASWTDVEPGADYTVKLGQVGEYEPGKFYLRELPPLLAVIDQLPDSVHTFVLDAYCHLDADGSPGLGAYLLERLPPRFGAAPTVVGVAKNRFRGTTHAAEVRRGESARPLFVTSIGLPYDEAGEKIRRMYGEFRIPTLIKQVDRLCRDALG